MAEVAVVRRMEVMVDSGVTVERGSSLEPIPAATVEALSLDAALGGARTKTTDCRTTVGAMWSIVCVAIVIVISAITVDIVVNATVGDS